MSFLNGSRLILLSLWLGAAVYFSAVVAPSAFSVLRSFSLTNASEIAGSIVTQALSVVNISGFVVGIFLLLTLFAAKGAKGRVPFLTEAICAGVLLITTGVAIG